MKIVNMLVTVAAVFTVATNANAAVFGLHGITDPNVPTGYVANEIIWDGGGTVDWPSAALRIDLSVGSFYQDPYGSDGPNIQPVIDLFPTVEFDTHVGITGDATAAIIGGAGDVGGGSFSMNAPQLSVSWFNYDYTNTGLTRIGMITLSDDAVGTGRMYSRGVYMDFTISNGQILDAFASVSASPTVLPDYVKPGPFPQLPEPPAKDEIGVTTRIVSSEHVPDGHVANEIIWNGNGIQDWSSTTMRVDLTSGDFFNHSFGFDSAPRSFLFESYPDLEFDTYVGVIDDSTGGIEANANELGGGSFSFETPHISVGWINTDSSDKGIVRIGMLTLSEDANGKIALSSAGRSWSVDIVNGVVLAPEPASLALITLAGPALLFKRRT